MASDNLEILWDEVEDLKEKVKELEKLKREWDYFKYAYPEIGKIFQKTQQSNVNTWDEDEENEDEYFLQKKKQENEEYDEWDN